MKIAITGGNGFLGRHFIQVALQKGFHVTALQGPGASIRNSSHFLKIVEGSLGNRNGEARNVLEGADVYINMAALGVQSRDRSWSKMIDVNCQQPLEWLEMAKEIGVQHAIALGTALEYAGTGNLPHNTPEELPAPSHKLSDEESSLECTDAYGATKAAGGILLRSYSRTIDLPLTYLRLASLFGPNDDARKFLPSAIAAARHEREFPMSQGEQVREWLHVTDAVNAILLAATDESPCEGIYNVGTGQGITLVEAAQNVFASFGTPRELIQIGKYKYRKNESHVLVMDCQKFSQRYAWRPTIALQDWLIELAQNHLVEKTNAN
ncbi:MAG: NAD(P)-dependent oxidoreductase [Deltaproteobacteria bacterium]|nr:NAD(P)-dependent oxidoreductase [Deltaproteobacteria bacterium]